MEFVAIAAVINWGLLPASRRALTNVCKDVNMVDQSVDGIS